MDQSPKAKQLILKYEQDTRNNKWYRKIAARLQRLSCCSGSETVDCQDGHCGGGDLPLSESPCLVEITNLISDNRRPDIKPLDMEDDVDRPKLDPMSLADLATEVYNKSNLSSGPRHRRRRHAFHQSVYWGGFHSFIADQ